MKVQKPLLLVVALLSLLFFSCSKKNSTETNPYPPITISGFTPAAGSAGGLIIVKGQNFTSQIASTHLLINSVQAEIENVSDTEIVARIPANCGSGKLAVRANGLEAFAATNFEYLYGKWSGKGIFPGASRTDAAGFAIGNKGYVVTGMPDTDGNGMWIQKDLWEYNSATNQWIQKADFPGVGRHIAVGFTIGNKGYIGLGWGPSGQLGDLWEYDPSLDTWTQKADFPGEVRAYAVAFTIGNSAYVGSGINSSYTAYKDFWKYDPSTDTWTRVADFPGDAHLAQSSFMINNIGYIGLGSTGTGMSKELWQYEPVTNTWTRKQNFPGAARAGAPAFAIGNKGYVGFGGYNVDFWEYEPVSDKWTQKANLQSYGAERSVTFTIGDKGYMATGLFLNQELWEFNPQ